jgi:hypothetical protein
MLILYLTQLRKPICHFNRKMLTRKFVRTLVGPGATTPSIMTLSIMTLMIIDFIVTADHYLLWADYHFAK